MLLRVAKSTAVAANVGAVCISSCEMYEPSVEAKYLSSERNTSAELTLMTPLVLRADSLTDWSSVSLSWIGTSKGFFSNGVW